MLDMCVYFIMYVMVGLFVGASGCFAFCLCLFAMVVLLVCCLDCGLRRGFGNFDCSVVVVYMNCGCC